MLVLLLWNKFLLTQSSDIIHHILIPIFQVSNLLPPATALEHLYELFGIGLAHLVAALQLLVDLRGEFWGFGG